MKVLTTLIVSSLLVFSLKAQIADKKAFADSIRVFQQRYKATHEVVRGKDRAYFRFFQPNADMAVLCVFEKINDTATVTIKTSGKKIPEKYFYRYGYLKFSIHDTVQQLTIYQSKDLSRNPIYKNYLFIPFTDATTGIESYGSGRYIDLDARDIKGTYYFLDFNKAYNPYCAYSNNYNCPIPPKENNLKVAITAGEKKFAKKVH